MARYPASMPDTPTTQDPAGPVVPASVSLAEITIRAVILGILLSAILAAANAYVGLLAGLTVSASIPAAVISMAVLKLLGKSNILENNIVQTAASAGESLAAGVIFTFPALIIMGEWTEFNYWQTTLIAGLGGVIGVLFTIPLRRALIVESDLTFPEGIATAEVLKVGDAGGQGIGAITGGAVMGAIFKLGESGLGFLAGTADIGRRVGNSIAYFGSSLYPALVAVGYIVGLNIAVLVFLGGAINWFVAIPIYAANHDWPVGDDGAAMGAVEWAGDIWSTQTRYLGVGAMLVGGIWAVIRLGGSLVRGVTSSIDAYRQQRAGGAAGLDRTERDTPIHFVGIALIALTIPLFFLCNYVTGSIGISLLMAFIMLGAGFLFSAVASYMAGLVGSSNNPISGVTIATILTASLLLLALMGEGGKGPVAAILIGAVVCCAAAIGGDNMQDLKAGRLVGATPYKQQIMQLIGVLVAAAVMAPVLQLLLKAYGIGTVGPDPLGAPQATLMASVAQGVFDRDLPWPMVYVGAGIAAVIIAIDFVLEKAKSSFRMPVLAVAVGIYLPLELATPILVGGLIAWAVARARRRRGDRRSAFAGPGVLLAAGLITGEALVGILLAIPIVANNGENPLQLMSEGEPITPLVWPGVALLAIVSVVLYVVGSSRATD